MQCGSLALGTEAAPSTNHQVRRRGLSALGRLGGLIFASSLRGPVTGLPARVERISTGIRGSDLNR
jgi:hypothetical protein